MGKKKYLFQVYLELVELSNVALRNEYIFVKIRQKNGGKLNYLSSKSEVRDHKVIWNEKINFKCKTQANASTGILNESYLRFSVRKESRLGVTQKLGFVDVNLSEFAGCGKQSGKYLLEEYKSHSRLDNSILKFFIDMQLISGDPLFKRHTNVTEDELVNAQQLSSMSSHHQHHHQYQQNQLHLQQYFPYVTSSTTPTLTTYTPSTIATSLGRDNGSLNMNSNSLNFNNHHYVNVSHHFVSDTIRSISTLKTPYTDENKLTDSTRVNNDVAVNEIIEQNLRYASSLPDTNKGLSLHDIR